MRETGLVIVLLALVFCSRDATAQKIIPAYRIPGNPQPRQVGSAGKQATVPSGGPTSRWRWWKPDIARNLRKPFRNTWVETGWPTLSGPS